MKGCIFALMRFDMRTDNATLGNRYFGNRYFTLHMRLLIRDR